MSQRHIVKSVKHGIIHLPDAPDHGFGAAPFRFLPVGCHVLVRNQHVPLRKIDILRRKNPPDGGLVVPDPVVSQRLANHRRINIRQKPESHRPVFVLQRNVNRLRGVLKGRGNINPAFRQQGAQEG